jgi:hypothetical protein
MGNVKIAALLATANVILPERSVAVKIILVAMVNNVVTAFVFRKMKYVVRREPARMDKAMAHMVAHKNVAKEGVFPRTKNAVQAAAILMLTVVPPIRNVAVHIVLRDVKATNVIDKDDDKKIFYTFFVLGIVIFLFIGFDPLYFTIFTIIVSNILATADRL